jgi:hypothetical protein
VRGRRDHRGSIHLREKSRCDALVFDAVLEADEWDFGARAGAERTQCGVGVLSLDREQHDVMVSPANPTRIGGSRDRQRDPCGGGLEGEPTRYDRVEMSPTRYHHHVDARLKQPSGHDTTDGARTEDYEPHSSSIVEPAVHNRHASVHQYSVADAGGDYERSTKPGRMPAVGIPHR